MPDGISRVAAMHRDIDDGQTLSFTSGDRYVAIRVDRGVSLFDEIMRSLVARGVPGALEYMRRPRVFGGIITTGFASHASQIGCMPRELAEAYIAELRKRDPAEWFRVLYPARRA